LTVVDMMSCMLKAHKLNRPYDGLSRIDKYEKDMVSILGIFLIDIAFPFDSNFSIFCIF
jgi:hypothetical protein